MNYIYSVHRVAPQYGLGRDEDLAHRLNAAVNGRRIVHVSANPDGWLIIAERAEGTT